MTIMWQILWISSLGPESEPFKFLVSNTELFNLMVDTVGLGLREYAAG